jgi:hypothetical protein
MDVRYSSFDIPYSILGIRGCEMDGKKKAANGQQSIGQPFQSSNHRDLVREVPTTASLFINDTVFVRI